MAGTFANGSTLKLGATTISEITNISGPNYSADTLDTSTHNSSDKFRTFSKGMIDGGEISIDGLINYTDLNALEDNVASSSSTACVITMPTTPSATKFEATVLVTSLEPGANFDGLLEFSSTMKVTGKPTLSQV
jgi:predicted secreted protein